MIVLDIETSGVDYNKNGIWQIAAMDLFNPSNSFVGECRIDDSDSVNPSALKVTGKTEEELRDSSKISQKELLGRFFDWSHSVKMRNVICQNPVFDLGFISIKSAKFGLHEPNVFGTFPFHYRSFDLHSIAQSKYLQVHGDLLLSEVKTHSRMDLRRVLDFCGIKDTRMKLDGTKVVHEGSAHDAVEDVRLTAEAFYRLMYGKNLLSEFSGFSVPQYLKVG